MAEPTFSATLERLYARLPEFIRTADGTHGWAAKRYLSLVADQAGDLETLLDRIDYITVPDGGTIGDTSELVDPAKADAAWLTWLAQLVSVKIGDLTTAALRAAIADARTGWQVGAQASVIAAAKAGLTGTKRVDISRLSQFQVQVITYLAETADAALIAKLLELQRPAHVEFVQVVMPGPSIDQLVGTIDAQAVTIDGYAALVP